MEDHRSLPLRVKKTSTPQLVFAKHVWRINGKLSGHLCICNNCTEMQQDKSLEFRRPPDFQPDSRAPDPEFHWTPHSGLECHQMAKFQTRNSTELQNCNPGICRTPGLRTRNPPESGIPRLNYPEFRWTPAEIQTGPGIPLEFHRNSGPIFTRVDTVYRYSFWEYKQKLLAWY